ncbi:hypothetical protein E3N88_25409 [Mikania micrantha]|uniref:Large ribosomal subunit protein uL4c n=1 Tax=Mikania micrantha TaxID=192012 RepID=A0A5N6N7G9_9ASTR|nr:hypothetical protein E3N88_25409 [Mikania micrantha]
MFSNEDNIVDDIGLNASGTASTPTRAEVRGGRKKPFPQKKVGRARPPLRPEGGIVFGLKRHDWSAKINKKEKRLAILTALAGAAVNGIMVEEFGDEVGKPSTKDFIEALKR